MRHRRVTYFFALAVAALTSRSSSAAPIEAAGESASAEKDARAKALRAAREAALTVAIEQVDHAIDEAAAREVMQHVEVWTSSYRVLERVREGDVLRLQVEFEIDLPRLTKRLALRPATQRTGFELGDINAGEGCPELVSDRPTLREALMVGGVPLFDGGQALQLELQCAPLGRVPATFVHGGRVVVKATLADGRVTRHESVAFAESPARALQAARDRSVAQVAAQLDQATAGSTVLRIHNVGDGARVRRLMAAIQEGVVGVDGVKLYAVEAGGVVQLQLQTQLEVDELGARIEALTFPDFNFALIPPAPNPLPQGDSSSALAASLVIDLEIL